MKANKKQYFKEYYQKNKDKIKLQIKQYLLKNKERIKQYYQRPEVKAKIKQYGKEYRKNNPDYYTKRNNYFKGYVENRRKQDPAFLLMGRLTGLLRSALKHYSTIGKIMISKKYGIDYRAIIEHLKPFPKDIENYHIDHIIPLSMFDFNNLGHIKKAFRPENHQWLTAEQNLWKSNRLVHPDFVNTIF